MIPTDLTATILHLMGVSEEFEIHDKNRLTLSSVRWITDSGDLFLTQDPNPFGHLSPFGPFPLAT